MSIYIPESITIRIGRNTIHCQNNSRALQIFWPSETQFKWENQRSIIQTYLPLVRTMFKKIIRDLQYPMLIALRLEGLGSRFEQIDENRIIFKIGRSHAYYLRVPKGWKIKYLTPKVCWFSGPNSTEVPLLVEILKRYKRLDKSHPQGFISSNISLPRLSIK